MLQPTAHAAWETGTSQYSGDLILVRLFVQPQCTQELGHRLDAKQRVLVPHVVIVEGRVGRKEGLCLVQRRAQFFVEFGLGSSRAWEGHIRSKCTDWRVPYEVVSYHSRCKHIQEVEGNLEKRQGALRDKGRSRIEFGERAIKIWYLTSLCPFDQDRNIPPQDLFRQDEVIYYFSD